MASLNIHQLKMLKNLAAHRGVHDRMTVLPGLARDIVILNGLGELLRLCELDFDSLTLSDRLVWISVEFSVGPIIALHFQDDAWLTLKVPIWFIVGTSSFG